MQYKAKRETWNLGGIYQIVSLKNGKKYIGSAVKFRKRFRLHCVRLRQGVHNSIILQNSYNKYDEENFVFEIIEIIPDELNLIAREQFYLDLFKPEYNVCKTAGSRLGTKQSPEAIEKTRRLNLGRKRTPETLERMRQANLGKIIPQEQRDKIRKSLTGRKMSAESGKKKSIALKGKNAGKICRPETRAKISAANIGRKLSDKQKQHLSKVNTGYVHSLEARLKILTHRRKTAKLDELKVKRIKSFIARGLTQNEIAQTFKIDRSTVSQIARGITWKGI